MSPLPTLTFETEIHAGQAQVIAEAARFNVLACGRRWGKTVVAQDRISETTMEQGLPLGYFTPTYKLLEETWRELCEFYAPAIARANERERRIETVTGGVLEMWSLDGGAAGRSRKYARVIVDEAGEVPKLGELWNANIRPTLLDYRGDAYFMGTPRGRNYFYQLYQMGLDRVANPEWRSWQMPTHSNPWIDRSEIEALKKDTPEKKYRQEILAEFIDDAGGVFRFVRECATAKRLERGLSGRAYVAGLDWGRENDFTALKILDPITGEFVHDLRFTALPFAAQRVRIKTAIEAFGRCPVLAESNSIGAPNIEELRREGVKVTAFYTSGGSHGTKGQLIDAYTLGFEQKKIHLIAGDEVSIGEHEAYECEKLPAGGFRYSAPEGMHDDTVIAGALAWWQTSQQPAVQVRTQG